MAEAPVKLTKRAVDALQVASSDYIVWDSEVPGFGVSVRRSGRKSYLLKYRVGAGRGAKIRKPTIGVHGAVTPDQARAVAKSWLAEARLGGDPAGDRQAKASAPSMSTLCERYLAEHARPHKKPSSVEQDERMIGTKVLPALRKYNAEDVTRSEIQKLHADLSDRPYEANRVLALLSKMFNLAELWGLRPDGTNPCRHVRKYREEKRRRFLSEQELSKLGAALAAAGRQEIVTKRGAPLSIFAIAAIRLLTFTGARRGEILSLRWVEVNWDGSRLELSDSKTGEKYIYLPAPALQVLHDLPRLDDNPYVVAGGKPGAPLVNLKEPWDAIRTAADLAEVRLHDLRHSFASVGAMGGMSLPMIGALLGHSEVATTARYAHLADDPIRAAADQIGSRIEAAMRKDAG